MIDPKVIQRAIDKKISEAAEDGFRDHLGASLIGGLCEREIWYSFRWAVKRVFDARMLRLFNRGHREEERFEGWIKAISDNFWSIDPRTGKQIRISDLRGYFGGSLDGVVRNPAGYRGDFLTEFKTHSVKSYEKLVLKGVKVAKPEHYTQMQIYLKYQPKLKGALYFAIQKNDDAIYIEYIERDPEWADIFVDRAKRVILAIEPMQGHNGMSEYHFHCKYMCSYTEVCLKNKPPHKSCRSCAFIETTDEGWFCNKHNALRTSEEQRDGCDKYERGF